MPIAFCSVVILTMFAAECFDPRLMWDVADRRLQNRRPRWLQDLTTERRSRLGAVGT